MPEYMVINHNQLWTAPFETLDPPSVSLSGFYRHYELLKVVRFPSWPILNLANIFSNANYAVYVFKKAGTDLQERTHGTRGRF
ncbi:MAG: hypothetical protein AABZ44_04410, partial [Elusimicrobiota bacterium]